jgi:hypothetical protein
VESGDKAFYGPATQIREIDQCSVEETSPKQLLEMRLGQARQVRGAPGPFFRGAGVPGSPTGLPLAGSGGVLFASAPKKSAV